jgi:signal peptidase I
VSLTRRLLFGSNPRRTSVRIVLLASVSFVTFGWILIPMRADGISMLPAYQSGSLHLVNRFAFAAHRPRRGDVIAIRLAGPHVLFVKRIVALPGEQLEIVEGQVYVNGSPLAEPYVQHRRPWDIPAVTLSSREYYVIGDNRGMLARDHAFGRIDASRIVGKVIF